MIRQIMRTPRARVLVTSTSEAIAIRRVGHWRENADSRTRFLRTPPSRLLIELDWRAMRSHPRGRGHIVNISSFAGVTVPPMLALYSATKAFLTHLSMNLRFELRETPIGVTKVEIGEVADTGLMEKGRTSPALAGWFDRLYRARLSRLVTSQEITTATLAAVRENRASVRLPRRLSPTSLLVDLPRVMVRPFARGLMPLPRSSTATK